MKHTILAFFIMMSASNITMAATIQVGQTRAVKDLSKIADGNEYVLDWQATPYVWGKDFSVKKSLIIRSANPTARATIQFPIEWGVLPTGTPDEGMNKGNSIMCYGTCTFKDMKTSGGPGIIVFGTQPGSTLIVQHVDMLDGGGILRGSGGNSAQIINVQSAGKPTAYFVANFNNPMKELLIDLTANTMPVLQGGHCMSGKPSCTGASNDPYQGETAIRIMDTVHLVMKGVNTVPWLYDGKHALKQVIQMRGQSGHYEIFNSNIHNQASIGDIKSRTLSPTSHVNTLDEIDFTNCTFDQNADVDPGVKQIKYVNSKIAGVLTNKTVNYVTTCPATGTVANCTIKAK